MESGLAVVLAEGGLGPIGGSIVVTAAIVVAAWPLVVWTRRRPTVVSVRRASRLNTNGHFQEAEERFQAILRKCHRPRRWNQTIALAAGLGIYRARFQRGDWAGAESMLRAILARYDPAVRPGHQGLLVVRRSLAHLRLCRGAYAEALEELRALAAESRERLGERARVTLGIRGTLAKALGLAGHADEAVRVRREVLDDSAGVPRITAPAVCFFRLGLVKALITAGSFAEAEDEFARLVPSYDPRGASAEMVLAFRSCSAALAAGAGRYDDAERQGAGLLAWCVRRYGEEHPWTLETRFELARLRHRAGDPAAAAEHRAVLDGRIRVLGEAHPATCESREALQAG